MCLENNASHESPQVIHPLLSRVLGLLHRSVGGECKELIDLTWLWVKTGTILGHSHLKMNKLLVSSVNSSSEHLIPTYFKLFLWEKAPKGNLSISPTDSKMKDKKNVRGQALQLMQKDHPTLFKGIPRFLPSTRTWSHSLLSHKKTGGGRKLFFGSSGELGPLLGVLSRRKSS